MKKYIAFGIIILFIGTSVTPSIIGVKREDYHLVDDKSKVTFDETSSANNETEYWALLIGVDISAGHPEKNIPSVREEVEYIREKLPVSNHWKEENIKVIKGIRATFCNIIRGFRWLDRKEDENDISLVCISTHGGQLSKDIWPRDEWDGRDEVLSTFMSFMFPWTHIRDDFLNLLLSLLESKGVCVVIESCHSGGFNDTPYITTTMNDNKIDADEWMHEFAEEISGSGRIVIMSCREEELSYAQVFNWYLIRALTGYADYNEDKLVSAEEAYEYIVKNIHDSRMNPTIYDGYPGELQLTEVQFPPSKPKKPKGQIIGDTNTPYNYSTVSIDPEGGKISYGWDWNGNRIIDEWTDPVDSNTTMNTSHSWPVEGTYAIRLKAKDDHGLLSDWSNRIHVMMCDENIPDQIQTQQNRGHGLNDNWVAMSFVPSADTLSKMSLFCSSWGDGKPQPLHLYIRDNLSGDNLAETSEVVPTRDYNNWYTFDFDDIDVIPGKTYYIVCKEEGDWRNGWGYMRSDCYPLGTGYYRQEGFDWQPFWDHYDFTFVTWAKA